VTRANVTATGLAAARAGPRSRMLHRGLGALGEGRTVTHRYAEVLMSAQEIDAYLEGLDEPRRSTLQQLRETILEIVPDAEQCISYGLPAFRVHGRVVAGFAAFKNHLSYLPHSGSVLPELGDDFAGYGGTRGSLHFPIDRPLPKPLVEKLIATRLRQISER